MSRDFPMFGLRMHPDLKAKLSREAKINGRSLNAEITHRLQISLEAQDVAKAVHTVEQAVANYVPEINDIERQLLTIFRRMAVEKQLALISLFK